MNNLEMGLFNNFEATLHEPLEYVNNLQSTDESTYQTVKLVPKNPDKWPADISAYFTSNPCYVFMTFYIEGTEQSANYKIFFDGNASVSPEGVISVLCVLEEQPAFKRDIPTLTSWPIGTLVSNTASRQTIGAFADIAAGEAGEVDVRLSALIAENTADIAANTLAIEKNTSDVFVNTGSIASNTASISSLIAANTAQDVKIKANEDAVNIFTNMVSEEVGADRIPKANDQGKISANWVDGLDISGIMQAIANVDGRLSETAEVDKAPIAKDDGVGNVVFDQTVKDAMVGGVRKQSSTTPTNSEAVTFEVDGTEYYLRTQLESGAPQLTFTDGTTQSVKISPTKGFFMVNTGGAYGWTVPQARTSTTPGDNGYFASVYTIGTGMTLPVGGVWEHVIFNYTGESLITLAHFRIGVSAGGTAIALPAGYAGLVGYMRRII